MRNRVAIKKKSDVLWHAPVSIIAALAIYYLFINLGNETGLGRDGSTLGCVLFWAITVCGPSYPTLKGPFHPTLTSGIFLCTRLFGMQKKVHLKIQEL